MANSVRTGAYAGVLNQTFIVQNTISMRITVAAPRTISLYAARQTGTTYSTSAIASDTVGYTQIHYAKLNDT